MFPHVIPNLYEFISYVEHTIRFLKNAGNQTIVVYFPTMKVNGNQHILFLQISVCVQHKKETGERHEGE